jgi:hypothetical protein
MFVAQVRGVRETRPRGGGTADTAVFLFNDVLVTGVEPLLGKLLAMRRWV